MCDCLVSASFIVVVHIEVADDCVDHFNHNACMITHRRDIFTMTRHRRQKCASCEHVAHSWQLFQQSFEYFFEYILDTFTTISSLEYRGTVSQSTINLQSMPCETKCTFLHFVHFAIIIILLKYRSCHNS